MNLMLRHMLYRVIGPVAAVSTTLVIIVLLGTTQRLFYLLTEGAISPSRFLLALAVLLPAQFYNMVPFGLTIAVIHAYLRWGLSNEIVSLRMAGLSDRMLAMPGLGAAAVATIFTASMSLYLVPLSVRTFEDIVYSADFDLSLALLDEGYLQQIAPDLSISFRRRLGANRLEGVTILDGRKADSFTYILAEQAQLLKRQGGDERARVLVLQKGSYEVRQNSEHDRAPVEFAQLILPISESADGSPPTRDWHGTYEQPIARLLDPPPSVREKPSEYGEWLLEGHKRIIIPLLCLSYAAFAVGGMLTAHYERHSAPMLRVAGIAAGIAIWHGFVLATHSVLVRVPMLVPVYYVVASAPGAVGVLLLVSTEHSAGRTMRRLTRRSPTIRAVEAESGTG